MKQFDKVQIKKPGANKFDLSHGRKFSCNWSNLYPVLVQEVLPGDRFRVSTETMIRTAPLVAPVMHRINSYIHYFFVPDRLTWTQFEEGITGGEDGTSNPVFPYFNLGNLEKGYLQEGGLADHMGVPTVDLATDITNTVRCSAIPFRAYQKIWDEYYRDQNLEDPIGVLPASGQVSGTELAKTLTMRQRAWEKDYLTSSLPWAQRGAPVNLPVDGIGTVAYKTVSEIYDSSTGTPLALDVLLGSTDALGQAGKLKYKTAISADGVDARLQNINTITIDGQFTINDFRTAARLQEWLEKNATGGSRYTEQIRAHFGVTSSDARLQRPEYLGGGRSPIVVSEVLSTFQESEGSIPQGNMAGHGVSVGKSNRFARRFEEHGYILGIMSLLPETAYQQGLPRHFSRDNKLAYAFPEFAHLGEQAVLNQEVFVQWTGPNGNAGTFGYQSRFSEYKYNPSTVHGQFRSTLNFWHLGRIFDIAPPLNASFIKSDPSYRIFAVTDPSEDHFYVQMFHRIDAIRLLPYFGTPSIS